MLIKIGICLIMFMVYVFYRECWSHKIKIKFEEIKKFKYLPKIMDYLFSIFVLTLMTALFLTLFDPVINKERYDKDNNFRKKVLDICSDKDKNLENYKKRIVEMHKQVYKSSQKDAEEWALIFLSNL